MLVKSLHKFFVLVVVFYLLHSINITLFIFWHPRGHIFNQDCEDVLEEEDSMHNDKGQDVDVLVLEVGDEGKLF